ncbi:MAG: HIT family protein [Firmicutes bacterium]|nr:HIT family protein [Bacillota bacterium]
MVSEKECLYCGNKEKLDSLMIPICELKCTKLYLFRDQTYYGRCVIAYKDHARELYELSSEESSVFIEDMKTVGLAIQKAVNADKINYGMYSDTLPHLHVHIVPKVKDGYGFGGTFEMNSNPPKYLSDDEYKVIIEKIKENL